MCGIAGWIDHSQDMSERIDLLNKMSETLDSEVLTKTVCTLTKGRRLCTGGLL